jgi:hypothetical protein
MTNGAGGPHGHKAGKKRRGQKPKGKGAQSPPKPKSLLAAGIATGKSQ